MNKYYYSALWHTPKDNYLDAIGRPNTNNNNFALSIWMVQVSFLKHANPYNKITLDVNTSNLNGLALSYYNAIINK